MTQAMPRTRIKICGIRRPDDALAAAHAGADAIGLVFVERSPRRITVDEAKRIIRALPPFVEPIGLFVDDPPATVRGIADELRLRTVQLHGREGAGYVAQLDGLKVVKALSFDEGHAAEKIQPWRDGCKNLTGILWDAVPPQEAAELTGGSGRSFDWAALAALQDTGQLDGLPPTILAGGLTPLNVGDAIATVRPYAVDVSSGVEGERGVKDADKIRAFCDAARAADAAP